MDADRHAPGSRAPFPPTRLSAVVRSRSADPGERRDALGRIVGAYWKPAYAWLRLQRGVSRQDAEDLVQDFFARALERDVLQRYDPSRARFRTFLRTCLDGHLADARKAAGRLKRGGGRTHLSLDFDDAEAGLAGLAADPGPGLDDLFHREWVRELFGRAVDGLRAELEAAGRAGDFALFEAYDLAPADGTERPTYGELADRHEVPVTTITNRLATTRAAFRRVVLERLTEITGSPEEARAEARTLFGPRVA